MNCEWCMNEAEQGKLECKFCKLILDKARDNQ